jgi:hypothetical protein
MNEIKKSKRTMLLAILYCCIYLLLTIFYHHIDKYLTGYPFIILTLLIPLTFFLLVVNGGIGIIKIFRHRQNINLSLCSPTIIYTVTLLYTLFSPYRLDSENLESPVAFQACYEGTQNQAYILFRQDKTFELNWTGVFGYDKWYTGHWRKKGTQLHLYYNTVIPKQLGTQLLLKKGYLVPIDSLFEQKKYPRVLFYLGNCKNQN